MQDSELYLQGRRLGMPYFHIDAEGYDGMDFDANTADYSELDRFPDNFQIGRWTYVRAGMTFSKNNNHFVSLIRHNGQWVFYDGLMATKPSRLLKDIRELYLDFKVASIDYVVVP
jgi:hypothetical protein